MWYHFWRRTLHGTSKCTYACNPQRNRDQRGGPNQISFSEYHSCRDGCGVAKHQPDECCGSYCQHRLFHSERDRYDEYGGGLEFERSGLQRRLLWIPGNKFDDSCLYGAIGGTFTGERYRGCNQHGGTEQNSLSKRNHCSRDCRHCDACQHIRCNGGDAAIKCVCFGDFEYRCHMECARSRM